MPTVSQLFFVGLALLALWKLYFGITTGAYRSWQMNAVRKDQPVKYWYAIGVTCAILAFCVYGLVTGL